VLTVIGEEAVAIAGGVDRLWEEGGEMEEKERGEEKVEEVEMRRWRSGRGEGGEGVDEEGKV
jgi:hypothetical protein